MKALLLLNLSLLCLSAQAESLSAHIDSSAHGYQGNLSVNQASGTQQQQTNARVISVGGFGDSSSSVRQVIGQLQSGVDELRTQASIDGHSFSQGSGVLGVNQSAGLGNQQANVVRVTLLASPQSLDDSVLAQSVSRADETISAVPAGGERRAQMSDEAFSGSRGVVQLNQSSGIGNRTANNLSIRVVD